VDGTWSGLATRSAADLNMSTRTTSDELYLDVIIDDGSPVFLKVPKGEGSVVLAKGLKAGEHKLAIHKRVESAVGILEVVSMK
jgi:hypothetical protein